MSLVYYAANLLLVENVLNVWLYSVILCSFIVVYIVIIWNWNYQIITKLSDLISKRSKKSSTLQSLLERKQKFLDNVKDGYGYRSSKVGFIDEWRKKEFPNLLAPIRIESFTFNFKNIMKKRLNCNTTNSENADEVYLDYAGSSLPSKSHIKQIYDDIGLNTLANPHSQGPAASRTMRLIEISKKRILDHFNADSGRFAGIKKSTTANASSERNDNDDDWHPGYEVVFTSGATDALRILAERFPWTEKSIFAYPKSIHTSVIGMRESAQVHGASFVCEPNISALSRRLLEDETSFVQSQESQKLNIALRTDKNLMAFPLECNFTGDYCFDAQHVIRKFQQQQSISENQTWYTLLDMAKAASSGPVNLRQLNPDFACVSFYKLFGEPTGVGCLFVKRSIVDILRNSPTIEIDENHNAVKFDEWIKQHNQDPVHQIKDRCSSHRRASYFGGGSVDAVLPSIDFVVPRSSPSTLAAMSNGTVHFRGIASLSAGFDQLDRMGGMIAIRKHTVALSRELAGQLKGLKHRNGYPSVVIYGDWNEDMSLKMDNFPGPVVAFNIVRSDGSFVGYNEVSKLAALNNPPIQLRTGCFCNPGACQTALGLDDDEVINNYHISGHVCGDQIDVLNEKPTGAIRVSFGKESIWEDLDAVLLFIKKMFISTDEEESVASIATSSEWDNGPSKVVISEVYICPIKSCASQRVKRWQLEPSSGKLLFDREFALVDSSGSAMRLQTYPKMAHIKPIIDIETRTMKVTATGCQSHLLLNLDGEPGCIDDEHVVKVCGNRCSAMVWGDYNASVWFSDFLGVSCWLARHSKDGKYEIPDCTTSPSVPKPIVRQNGTAFANEQPILLISEHAVEALNEVLKNESRTLVSSRQFRPNVVVRILGLDSSDTRLNGNTEDGWKKIEMINHPLLKQKVKFDVVGPCARCSMVDIDPTTGMKGKTLRALAQYRRKNGQITFGIFLRATTNTSSRESSMIPKKLNQSGYMSIPLIDQISDYNSGVWIEEGDILLCY